MTHNGRHRHRHRQQAEQYFRLESIVTTVTYAIEQDWAPEWIFVLPIEADQAPIGQDRPRRAAQGEAEARS
jgi:hypothetical protein